MTTKSTFDEDSAALMAEIADLYYNQGLTQQEIAGRFECNRFKIAKMIQNARDEGIVEITVHKPNNRHRQLEKTLAEEFQLSHAIVLDIRDLSRTESMPTLGKAAAMYLETLLTPGSTIGVTWGKSVRSVVAALEQKSQNPVNALQLCGCFHHLNTADGSRSITHDIAVKLNGEHFCLNLPMYINDEHARTAMLREPMIESTLKFSRTMQVVLTGVGSTSSLPFGNSVLKPYIDAGDREKEKECIGSIYGRVIDREGRIADLALNKKLISAPLEDILAAPHRLGVAAGRHKTDILIACMRKHYINELITDRTTAEQILATVSEVWK